MGHDRVDLRLISSTWAEMQPSFLKSPHLFLPEQGGPILGLGSGEEAPQCDSNQGWPPSVNKQSIHQPVDSCGQDPA